MQSQQPNIKGGHRPRQTKGCRRLGSTGTRQDEIAQALPFRVSSRVAVMMPCLACKQLIVFAPIRREDKCFCSHACMNTVYPIGFCQLCLDDTDERSPANLTQAGGCGAGFYNSWWHANCPECGSKVARVWIALLGIPLIPLFSYRVFYLGEFEFFARRLLRHRGGRTGKADDATP